MKTLIILGTAREGRQSEKAANFVLEETKKAGNETELVDVKDYLACSTDRTKKTDSAKKFSEKVKGADAIIIVSPEYNHGYPGELKLMLDMLYEEYESKPVGICGVSMGGLGGARMVEQLRLVCIELKMILCREAVYFSAVQNLFDSEGKIKDSSYSERIKKLLSELESRILKK